MGGNNLALTTYGDMEAIVICNRPKIVSRGGGTPLPLHSVQREQDVPGTSESREPRMTSHRLNVFVSRSIRYLRGPHNAISRYQRRKTGGTHSSPESAIAIS